MTVARRVALFNPMAGQRWHARRAYEALALLQREEQVTVVETQADAVTQQARALLLDGATELIACGGDGTICDVAAALVGTSVPLRIVPTGTSNVLARDLDIPTDALRAVYATRDSTRMHTVNTWTLGDRPLVIGAGIGWDAQLLHRLPRRLKRAYGLGAMVPLGAWLALRYDFPALRIEGVDDAGQSFALDGAQALLANVSRWGGRNRAFPIADPFDDVIDIVVCEPRRFLHLMAFWALTMCPGGRPLHLPGVRHVRARSATIHVTGATEADVHVNGEVMPSLTVTQPPLKLAPAGRVQIRVPLAPRSLRDHRDLRVKPR